MAEPEASLIDRIASYDSVAIVGLAKNAGKTECLNYILRGLHDCGLTPAVTSIGVDGEQTDAVSHTRKPEITLFEETVFVTSESFYRSRGVTSEVLGIGTRATALGRLVTARVKTHGKVILAGPPDTASLRRLIADLGAYSPDVTLVELRLACRHRRPRAGHRRRLRPLDSRDHPPHGIRMRCDAPSGAPAGDGPKARGCG